MPTQNGSTEDVCAGCLEARIAELEAALEAVVASYFDGPEDRDETDDEFDARLDRQHEAASNALDVLYGIGPDAVLS